MENPKTIKVKIIEDTRFWYEKNKVYEVENHITYNYGFNIPHFHAIRKGAVRGIECRHCRILNLDEEPHTIQIDGKEIELSEESYNNIKKDFET